MNRAILIAGLLVFTSGLRVSQAAAEKPSFEAASVKVAAPITDGRMMVRLSTCPATDDPGRLHWTNVNLKLVLSIAYGVKTNQITGPDWLDSERFDITAKVSAGTNKAQCSSMLQSLLAERFHVTVHKETKELPIYALVVAKNGPKLKESEPDTASTNAEPAGPGPAAGSAPPPPPPPPPGANGAVMRMPKMGKDGFPEFPPGFGKGGNSMIMMPGRAKLTASKQTMSQFADALSNQLDRPVLDMTELKGTYDFVLTFEPSSMGGRGPMIMAPPPPGDSPHPEAPEGEALPDVYAAVQQQLGLKLDARKGPVELIVVESADKVPTEN